VDESGDVESGDGRVEMEMMCGEFEILLAENAKTGRSKYVQVEVFNAGDFYLALKSCSYIIPYT
jgi:hypothetical protein